MEFEFYKDENIYEKSSNEKITNLRKNIISWYKFNKNADILEITTDKHKFNKIDKEKKYDYVILIGTLEYANILIDSKSPYIDLLKFSKNLLKENGKLILAIDNSYGLKYVAGAKSNHCEKIFDSLKSEYVNGKLFSKSEIDQIIKELGFKNKKYYYPIPDYKYPSLIFTDEYLPYKRNGKINYIPVYDQDSIIVQNEVNLLKESIKNNKFEECTSSYLIELSNSELNNTKFISFNNSRKDEYSLILEFKDNHVEKRPKNLAALEHINQIKNNCRNIKGIGLEILEENTDDNSIKSDFSNLELFDSVLSKMVDSNEIVEAKELIDKWVNVLKEKLEFDENGITENGYIDLVFENAFYDEQNKKIIFFDQEWYVNKIPFDFIIYRAIRNFFIHNSNIKNKLNIEEILEKYNLSSRKQEFIEIEEKFQQQVVDKEISEFYQSQYKKYRILEGMIDYEKNLVSDNQILKDRIIELENENKNYKKKLEKILNSKSWKYTKFLRKNK